MYALMVTHTRIRTGPDQDVVTYGPFNDERAALKYAVDHGWAANCLIIPLHDSGTTMDYKG